MTKVYVSPLLRVYYSFCPTGTSHDLIMDELLLLSLNCHGFSMDTANYLSGILTDSNYAADILLLQETWLSTANCSRLQDISDEFVYFHIYFHPYIGRIARSSLR